MPTAMLIVLALCFACAPSRLGHVPGATRFAVSATGDLVVGTDDGRVVGINSFGDTWTVAEGLGAKVVEVVTDDIGGVWALTGDGGLHAGTMWAPFTLVQSDVVGVLFDCGALVVGTREAPGAWEGATALGQGWCKEPPIKGTAEGFVGTAKVSPAAIVRIATMRDGTMWVDSRGREGCLSCRYLPTGDPVLDARKLYAAPFIDGELVWLDTVGGIWLY